MVGMGLALNVLAGAVVGRVPAVWLIVGGATAGAAACLILSVAVEPSTPYYKAMLYVLILQVGPDVFFPAGSLYSSKSVGRQHQALAGSLFNTTIRVATSLGLAISSTISTSVTKAAVSSAKSHTTLLLSRGLSLHPSMLLTGSSLVKRAAGAAVDAGGSETVPVDALLKGYKAASWFCFACSVLSIIVALARLRSIGIVGGMEGKSEDSSVNPTRPNSPQLPQDDSAYELKTIVEPRDRKASTSALPPVRDDQLDRYAVSASADEKADEKCRGSTDVEGGAWLGVGGDDLLDDLLHDLGAEVLGGDLLGVLGGDDDGVDAEGDGGTAVLLVLDGDLGLGVGAEPAEGAVAAGGGHGEVELVREHEGHGHHLGGLVGGVAEHDTLVTGAVLLERAVVETLGNVGRLLLDGDEHVAGLVVEALLGRVVADLLDGVTDDLLVVDLGLGRDLTEDHDHTGLGGGLTGDLGVRVLLEAGVL
ncbi:hypothetical protein L1887_48875 [Cichorium endivia]|nr:hypothetical protein L1887_48875 [Cichorium endivia]